MLFARGLLPVRIPSRTAVHRTLTDGRSYRIATHNDCYLNITLDRVTYERPGHGEHKLTEHVVRDLLTLSYLAAPGERYVDPSVPDHEATTDTDSPDGSTATIRLTPRTARKITRILSTRHRTRVELGL